MDVAAAIQPARLLLLELETRLSELDEREAAIARAAEMLSESNAVQAAYRQAQEAERQRILRLIDLQLSTLNRTGLNALALRTLRRMVSDEVPQSA